MTDCIVSLKVILVDVVALQNQEQQCINELNVEEGGRSKFFFLEPKNTVSFTVTG